MDRFWNQLSSPRIIQVKPDCLQIRGGIVHHYALLEEEEITLIDGGFLMSRPGQTLSELAKLGYSPTSVRTILVSHGHLDHTLHLTEWKELTGAKILAPEADRDLLFGQYRHRGSNRLCGALEATARLVLRYQPPEVDHWFRPGESLPAWGGLDVIPLPGHTSGHSGFYSPHRELLFANDLFAHWLGHSHWPPRWLNESSSKIQLHAEQASRLPLKEGILLNHCDQSTATQLKAEFLSLLNH